MTDRLLIKFTDEGEANSAITIWNAMGFAYRTEYKWIGVRQFTDSTNFAAEFTDPEIYIMAKMAI